METSINKNSNQRFYLGKIYFLLFGIVFIFFALKSYGTYSYIIALFGILSLLLALKLKIFIKNKIIIYSFLAIVLITHSLYTIISNLSLNSIFGFIFFLIPGFIFVYKINVIPKEEFKPNKVSKKSLIPFFLITLVVTFIILFLLLYLNSPN